MTERDAAILKAFLEAGAGFVSGAALARRLGISRVAVWARLEKLREQGFAFEAAKSKGYRLAATPPTLNAALIKARLTRAADDIRLFLLDEIDSSNSEAERRLADGDPTPFLALARRQTSGRGRLGRKWSSPDNGNFYGSFAFRPASSPSRLSAFTLWIAANLCECLNAFCRVRCQVKWPNDLLIDGRKVAGILTEARMDADQTRDLVLGIGLNVNGDPATLPPEVAATATSLREAAGGFIDPNRLAAALVGRVAMAYAQFESGLSRSALLPLWRRHDALAGRRVSLLQNRSRIEGLVQGIDPSGALCLERPDGSRLLVRAGEVAIEK